MPSFLSFGCGGWTSRYSGLSFDNVFYRVTQRWDWDLVVSDLDGSIGGIANSYIISDNNITRANPNCRQLSYLQNARSCSSSQNWIRFAFNDLSPSFVILTNVTETGNTVSIPMLKKRLTHPFGFMIALEARREYLAVFDAASNPTNVTFTGTFYGLYPGDYVIIKYQLSKKPDLVEFNSAKVTSSQSLSPLTPSSPNGAWYWENSTLTLSYIISNPSTTPFLDVPVRFQAIKCRYVNCIYPVSPGLKPPLTSR